MNLSVSNIGWISEYDEEMYSFLSDNGFNGIEIAPTRIFPDAPYEQLEKARLYAHDLKKHSGLTISSIQSIWFGISESIFGTDDHRQKLINYTKSAVNFASAIGCANLVFGCPKNRAIPEGLSSDVYMPIAYDFFNQIGCYATENGVYISIEPNPPIYNTNFINTTEEAFLFCKSINNPGVKVNIDLGTMIYYNEDVSLLKGNIHLVNHVHISEPHLVPIVKRSFHKEILSEFIDAGYSNSFSIEMRKYSSIEPLKDAILYIKGVFRVN